MLSEERARRCLAEEWDLPAARLTRLDGGIGSHTWAVDDAGRRWVLKAVAPHLGDQLADGLAVAHRLDRPGIPAGRPEPTTDGSLTATADGCTLGLLAWVPGNPLTGGDEHERRLIGVTLARVHQALSGLVVPAARRFHWVDPAAARLSLRPWLRPAVAAAVADLEGRGPSGGWTTGLLHADPAAEAFRLDPATGQVGVIDWGVALHGPLLYDLASAAMYLGGLDAAAGMIEAYLASGMLSRAEADEGLGPMLRFRWAVQADYFALRITENDLTGIAGPQENEKGWKTPAAPCSPIPRPAGDQLSAAFRCLKGGSSEVSGRSWSSSRSMSCSISLAALTVKTPDPGTRQSRELGL